MRSEEKGRFEMLWDCTSCGTSKLLGLTHRHCPSCGSPQDPTRRYFPPEGEAIAVADHPYQGADVACPACETPNAARAAFCTGCGSPLEGAKAVVTRATQASAGGGFAEDSAAKASEEAERRRREERDAALARHGAASGAAPAPAPAPERSGPSKKTLGCLALLAVALLAAGVALFWKKDAALSVTSHAWERSIAIEVYGPKKDSDWRDRLPAGAYDVSCTQKERSTKKVEDGETCTDKRQDKGDGTFAVVEECVPAYREEPVYDDHCRYTVDAWQTADTAVARGAALQPAPSWPSVTLSKPGTCRGCQREGARKEAYTVGLRDEASGAEHACELPEARWAAMPLQSRWVASVGVVTGALDCAALQPR